MTGKIQIDGSFSYPKKKREKKSTRSRVVVVLRIEQTKDEVDLLISCFFETTKMTFSPFFSDSLATMTIASRLIISTSCCCSFRLNTHNISLSYALRRKRNS